MKVTIGDLFNFIKSKNIDLSKDTKISVNTRQGYKRILACDVTLRDAKPVIITLDNGYYLICSKDHKILKLNGNFERAGAIKVGTNIQTDQGTISVASKTNMRDRIDLYDIQVEDIEEYYSNGIVSHNSTIIDSIRLGIYNKTNKPLKSVANRLNGHGEIEIGLETKNKVVTIERNFAPNKQKLFLDGELFDIAAKKDVQKYIDEELLNLSYYVFNNIITLSINDFKSFLSMSPSDKRLIIDKIFSLSLLNDMKEDVKQMIKEEKGNLDKLVDNTRVLENNIEKYTREIAEIKRLLRINNDSKIEEIKEKIKVLEEQKGSFSEDLEKYRTNIDKIDEVVKKLNKKYSEAEGDLRSYQKQIKLYEQGKCGTCGSDLTGGEHKKHKEELEANIESSKSIMEELDIKITEAREKYRKVKDKLSDIESNESELAYEIRTLNRELVSLKVDNDVDDSQTSVLERMKEEATEQLQIKTKSIESIENKIKFYGVAEKMLGEKGIKQLAVASIVPSLNDTINEYLGEFERGLMVEFDEDFESKIYDRGIEIENGDLSLGEHKILDFVVLITIIKLLKTRYHDLNIIFLDEIFASLDIENVQRVLKILKKVCKELKLNVFVIHHSILDTNIFDTTIKVNKDKGWSNLEII